MQKKMSGGKLFFQCLGAGALILLTMELVLFSTPYLADGLSVLTLASAALQEPSGFSYFTERWNEKETATESSVTLSAAEEPAAEAAETSSEPETTTESVPEEIPLPEPQPQKRPDNAGEVRRYAVGGTGNPPFLSIGKAVVKNMSDYEHQTVLDAADTAPDFSFGKTKDPQVLIYHTHATESYLPDAQDWYPPDYSARSTDPSQNMVAVGNALAAVLEAGGITVIHDETLFDHPSYTEGYDRSREAVKDYLEKYPSIRVVLDVHRDALQADSVITAPVASVDGVDYAQLMVVACADDGDGELPHDLENLSFGAALANQLETDYPGITRPLLFCERFYNQDLSTGSLLIEVGGHGNSLKEAILSAQALGESLLRLL